MPYGINSLTGKGSRWRHGYTRTPTYKSWAEMRSRCLNKRNTKFKWYGGRGITICARWDVFENFLEDMGERPLGLTLDRIDVNGGYELSNCRWATKSEQMNNMRSNVHLTIDGREMTMSEAGRLYGVNPGTIWARIHNHGWDEQRAVKTPSRGWRKS